MHDGQSQGHKLSTFIMNKKGIFHEIKLFFLWRVAVDGKKK